MDKNKVQIYFSLAEQERRLNESMSNVRIEYQKFLDARKKGKLKVDTAKAPSLFDV